MAQPQLASEPAVDAVFNMEVIFGSFCPAERYEDDGAKRETSIVAEVGGFRLS